MNDGDDLAARLHDAEEALRGLHRKALRHERELEDLRAELAKEQAARAEAEAQLAELLATKTMRALRVPREGYARLRRR